MSIRYLLFAVILIVMSTSETFSQNNFSWEMFVPATTNQCRPDNLPFCNSQLLCESRGGYFYDNSCYAEPAPVCSSDRPDLCTTEQTCISAGGYWYDNSCYRNQSPNYTNTAKISGDWLFVVSAESGKVNLPYVLDINTIIENPAGSGKFTIGGRDGDLDQVTGTYVPENNNYTMFVAKTDFDIMYEFTFIGVTSDVTGCYYEIDKTDGAKSICSLMVGAKLK